MLRGKLLSLLLLFVVVGLFFYGTTKLLILRFQKGDVYPPYSSFRSDPLGTKAFYEGLGLLPGVETVRNVEPIRKASELSGTALFLFGLERFHLSAIGQESAKTIDEAALAGARIVISFAPTNAKPCPPSKENEKQEPPQKKVDEESDEEEELFGGEYIDLNKNWGVETELSEQEASQANLSATENSLPHTLTWHSTLFFEPKDDAWHTIYERAGKPVLIERSYGKGRIILSSDSFFLSNEAMKSTRYPDLLSWLCGPHKTIIFDETHLGVSKSPGIVTLLRKYGLAPFIISLLVLAILAIWKQSVRFVPAYEEDEQAVVDPGKDSSTGLTNLLHRNISHTDILPACLEEWKRSFTHGKQDLSALLPRIQEIIAEDRVQPRKNRNPVQAYRKISGLQDRR
jgi:hypothetical protein